MIDAVAVVVGAFVTATFAVRLDRFFQEIDSRRDLYLEVLTYLDNIAVMIMEQLVADAPNNTTNLRIERELITQKTKLDLVASEPVRNAYDAYREASPKVMEAVQGPPPDGAKTRYLPTQLRFGLQAVRTERDALAAAMRADLKQRPWARRKS